MTTMEQQRTEWLTVEDIAEELEEKPNSVREWIRSEKLPAYKFGRRFKVKREDLNQFLEDRRFRRQQ